MTSLILRKVYHKDPEKQIRLELREHGPAEVQYTFIAYVDSWMAEQLSREGSVYWLYNDPEMSDESKALRESNHALKKAWDQYQMLKKLVKTPSN